MDNGDYVVARDGLNENDGADTSPTKSVAIIVGLSAQALLSIKSTIWTLLFGYKVVNSIMIGND